MLIEVVVSKYERTELDVARFGPGAIAELASILASWMAVPAVLWAAAVWLLVRNGSALWAIPAAFLLVLVLMLAIVAKTVLTPTSEDAAERFIRSREGSRYRMSSQSITLIARHGETEMWPRYFRFAVRTKQSILLRVKAGFIVLPERCFESPADADEALRLIREMGVPVR